MITAPSNSQLVFVIIGSSLTGPLSKSSAAGALVHSIDKSSVEDGYDGECPLLLQSMQPPCSMTPLNIMASRRPGLQKCILSFKTARERSAFSLL